MADFKIGANLYADTAGRYYSLNGATKSYQESPFEGTQKKITELYDAQKKNQLAALQAQRTKAVAGFNQQKKDLAPGYQNQRNQADVVNAQNVARLRELMAANGVNASGENLTTQAQMASSRQSALSEIDNNEQTAIRGIDKQIADANDISKDQAITNEIEAKRSEAMLNAYQNWQQEIYQREQDWRNYEMQQAQLAASRARAAGGSSGRRSRGSKKSGSPSSYADWLGYFKQNSNAIANAGLPEFEQQILNNKSFVNSIKNSGYNMNDVIDSMYSAVTGGKYNSKTAYADSMRKEEKLWHTNGGRASRL